MKPAAFEYYDPKSLAEALALLRRHGGEARPLAGGQSLVPLMNLRLASPAVLVDLNRIPELAYIRQQKGKVHIGAMTRQRAIEFSPLIRRDLPLLGEATRMVGHLPTRTRGTIGGSLAHADPAAEYPCVVAALEGELVLQSGRRQRVVAAADFFQGLMSTAIRPDELLIEIRLPAVAGDAGWAFEEFSVRRGDFALAGIAAMLRRQNGRCRAVRLAACAAGPAPVRLRRAESIMEGGGADDHTIEEAAKAAAQEVEPAGDIHASADFRRHLVHVLTRRALRRAIAQSGQRL